MIAGITALPFGLLWSILFSIMMGIDFGQVLKVGIWAGIAFGLFFGFVMAFFMKANTISILVHDKKSFIDKLNIGLAEIGYHPESQTDNFLTFKPSFQAGLLAGKISIQIGQNSATIIGPSTYVKKLQKRIQ